MLVFTSNLCLFFLLTRYEFEVEILKRATTSITAAFHSCSSRKQSVCSYHKNRLVCSGSSRYWPIMPTLMLVLLFSFVVALQ